MEKYRCYQYVHDEKRVTEYVGAESHWFDVKIPFGQTETFGTALEVKKFLGAKPALVGSFDLEYTPIGRPIRSNIQGNTW